MSVAKILEVKGSDIVSTGPDATVAAVVKLLNEESIGTAMVLNAAGGVLGVISERDIIHGIAAHGPQALGLPVRELMTSEVITCQPTDGIYEVMAAMHGHGFRHLPVMEEGELKGIMSMRDAMAHLIEALKYHIGN